MMAPYHHHHQPQHGGGGDNPAAPGLLHDGSSTGINPTGGRVVGGGGSGNHLQRRHSAPGQPWGNGNGNGNGNTNGDRQHPPPPPPPLRPQLQRQRRRRPPPSGSTPPAAVVTDDTTNDASSGRDRLRAAHFDSPAGRSLFHVDVDPSSQRSAFEELEARIARLHRAWESTDGWKHLLRGEDASERERTASSFSRSDVFNLLKKALLVKTAMRKALYHSEIRPQPAQVTPAAGTDEGEDGDPPDGAAAMGRGVGVDLMACCREAVEEVDVNVRRKITVYAWCHEFNSAGGYFCHPAETIQYVPPRLRRKRAATAAATGGGCGGDGGDSDGDPGGVKRKRATCDPSPRPPEGGGGDRRGDDCRAGEEDDNGGSSVQHEQRRRSKRSRRPAAAAAGDSDAPPTGSKPTNRNEPATALTATTQAATPVDTSAISPRFMSMFDQLRAYRDLHGDCLVPQGHAADPKLARWVRTLRHHRKAGEAGKFLENSTFKSQATQKIALLDSIGFAWSLNPRSTWDDRLRELRAYREEHGDLLVPCSHPVLGTFVTDQRCAYKRMKSGRMLSTGVSRNCLLTEARIRQLDELGFVWSIGGEHRRLMAEKAPRRQKSWEARLEQLVEYRRENGHCDVPRSHPELGAWVRKQRHNRKLLEGGRYCDGLTEERVGALTEAGFNWSATNGKGRVKPDRPDRPGNPREDAASSTAATAPVGAARGGHGGSPDGDGGGKSAKDPSPLPPLAPGNGEKNDEDEGVVPAGATLAV